MTDLQARHDRVMGDGAPMFFRDPIPLVRGEGVLLYDRDGTEYLDVYNNVPCVGHANPRVAAAVADQMGTLNVHSRYLHEGVIAYGERLAGLHADGLDAMVITCSGTEANEVAIMMARAATGARGVIGTDATYHGNLGDTARLTRLATDQDRQGVRSIATPQTFRPLAPDLSDEELCARHLADLQRVIDGLRDDGLGVAALMLCTILANEGLPRPPAGFLPKAVAMVREAGGLVIGDEVQAGFARSGRWWGYETNGFVPDIVTMGKPMGNGLPVAAALASHDLVTGFRRHHRYFNTFAASPLQAAAGDAVLSEIEDRGLVAQVAAVGQRVQDELRTLAADHPRMGDVRGEGLFIGVDWVRPGTTEPDPAGAAEVVEAMKARRVLMGVAGQHGNVLKVRPPLVFDDGDADRLLEAFATVMAQ